MMIRAADLLAEGRRIPGMAGAASVIPDWAPVAARIRNEATDDWDDRVAVEPFEGPYSGLVRHSGRVLQALTYAPTGAMVAGGLLPALSLSSPTRKASWPPRTAGRRRDGGA
jgi:hypothetical protein